MQQFSILLTKKIIIQKQGDYLGNFSKTLAIPAIIVVAFFAVDSSKLTKISENTYVNEISGNFIYQLFSAYRNNQIDYDTLYATHDIKKAIADLRLAVAKQEPRSKFLSEDDISRFVPSPEVGEEKKYNIIFIAIESFSAEFMMAFGNKEEVTPNLDKLAKEGLFFTNLKATGTRTVRGS